MFAFDPLENIRKPRVFWEHWEHWEKKGERILQMVYEIIS